MDPDFRLSGDNWSGSNALTYEVYSDPVLGSDGVTVVTPRKLLDLTGFTVVGTGIVRETGRVLQSPLGAVEGLGLVSLSWDPPVTNLFRQDPYTDMSQGQLSLLLVRPAIVDPSGKRVTVAIQPLFVF